MYYVYLIKSLKYSNQMYVGITTNFKKRLICHNSGGSFHTAKFKPWELITFICFKDKVKATEFEKYLKSQSGRAFAKKRLI
ncbi:MAG: GIY-YIG nuclease family protein [Candidatus Dependentiae bacterium]